MSTMGTVATVATVAVLAQTGSGIRIPFDPATDVIYVLVGLTLFIVWYGDRKARRAREEDELSAEQGSGDELEGEEEAER